MVDCNNLDLYDHTLPIEEYKFLENMTEVLLQNFVDKKKLDFKFLEELNQVILGWVEWYKISDGFVDNPSEIKGLTYNKLIKNVEITRKCVYPYFLKKCFDIHPIFINAEKIDQFSSMLNNQNIHQCKFGPS